MEAGDTGKEPEKPVEGDVAKGPDTPEKAADTPPKATAKSGAKPPGKPADRRKLLRIGVIAIAVVVALVAWLATRDSGSGSTEPATAEAGRAADRHRGRTARSGGDAGPADLLGRPGDGQGAGAEGTGRRRRPGPLPARRHRGGEGLAQVADDRQLPAARSRPRRWKASPSATARSSRRRERRARSGDQQAESPTSVYFASPDNSVQVEVYDPSPQRAMSLALSGKVQPAG